MNESHQATWTSVAPVLLATLVPVAAALGIFMLATYGKKEGDVTKLPSNAAFDACLSENNLQAQTFKSEFDRDVWSREALKVCGDKLPPRSAADQTAAEKAQAAFRKCVEGLAGRQQPRFRGRFRFGQGSSRSEYRNAVAVCRNLMQGGGGNGEPAVPKPNAGGPIA